MTTQERVDRKEANRFARDREQQQTKDRADGRRIAAMVEVTLWHPDAFKLRRHHFGRDCNAVAIVTGTTIVTQWRATLWQRLLVLVTGRLWLGVRATANGVDQFVTAGDPYKTKGRL